MKRHAEYWLDKHLQNRDAANDEFIETRCTLLRLRRRFNPPSTILLRRTGMPPDYEHVPNTILRKVECFRAITVLEMLTRQLQPVLTNEVYVNVLNKFAAGLNV